MTFYVEEKTDGQFDFDVAGTVEAVGRAVLETERCPHEAQVNVLLTDNAEIKRYNERFRGIDRETDVLSFPNLDFCAPADFSGAAACRADCFEPDSGELILGDIVVSVEKVREQAEVYGHSRRRELAFLVAHSMLHLCGYDHAEEDGAAVMEGKQEYVLSRLGITRED